MTSVATMELQEGLAFETTFWRNEGAQKDAFPFRATHINGKRSPKVILCSGKAILLGKPVRVKVVRVTRLNSAGRGFAEVEYLGPVEFRLDPDIYVDKMLAKKLQVLLEAGQNILLDGPQGSGKTVLSRSIAQALDMEYVYFNCSSVYEATDFVSTLQVRATEHGQPETVFVPTDIYRAIQQALEEPHKRFLIFLDEFNRCREMARNGLMPALDATRKIFDPMTNSLLDIPDNVQFIAAINTGAQFTGATAVDPAQLDRFTPLKMRYPPPEEEAKILRRRYPMLAESLVRTVVEAADAVRKDMTLGLDLSMRATDEACMLLSHPAFSEETPEAEAVTEVLSTSFCGRFAGMPDDESSEAGMVWAVVQNALKKGKPSGK